MSEDGVPSVPKSLPRVIPCVAGVPTEWQDGFTGHYIYVIKAKGVLTIEIAGYGKLLNWIQGMGQWCTMPRGIQRMKLTSTEDEDVTVQVGDDRVFITPTSDPSGGGLPIQGQYPNFTLVPVTPATARFLTGGMLKNANGVTGTSEPLTETEAGSEEPGSHEVAVGFNSKVYQLTLNVNQLDSRNTSGYASLNIVAGGNWVGPIQVKEADSDAVIPLFDAGGVPFPDGIIYAPGVYTADMTGCARLVIRRRPLQGTDSGTAELFVTCSRTPQSRLILTAPIGEKLYTDPTEQPFALGPNNLIVGVANKKIRVFGVTAGFDAPISFQFFATDGLGTHAISARRYTTNSYQDSDEPLFETGVGQQLDLAVSLACNGSVNLRYELVNG